MTTYLICTLALGLLALILITTYSRMIGYKIKYGSNTSFILVIISILIVIAFLAMGITGFAYDKNQRVEKFKVLAVVPGKMNETIIDYYGTAVSVDVNQMENEIYKILGRQVLPGDDLWLYYCEDLYANKYFKITNVATPKQAEHTPIKQ